MQTPKTAEDGQDQAPAAYRPSAYEVLLIFTAGWLGGGGLLAALFGGSDVPTRILGAGEAVAAVLWFVPRYRLAGFGAMLAVLAFAVVDHLLVSRPPGALLFYAAVVVYLAAAARRDEPPA